MKKLLASSAFALVLLPAVAFAAVDPGTSLDSCQNLASNGIASVVTCLIGFMNNALYLIMGATIVYIAWGAFQLMQEKKRDEAKKAVTYGIIGLFVMISIWGLVNILYNTFHLSSGAKAPPALTPQSSSASASLKGPIQ